MPVTLPAHLPPREEVAVIALMTNTDIGLLILRLVPGLFLFAAHGWSKLTRVPGMRFWTSSTKRTPNWLPG